MIVGIFIKSVALWLVVQALGEFQAAAGGRLKRTTCLKYPSLPFGLVPPVGFRANNSSRINGTAPAANASGDQSAQPGQFPAFVRLSVTDFENFEATYSCGATLIGHSFLLTAASCVRIGKPIFVHTDSVLANETFPSSMDQTYQAIESCYITDSVKHGDIALIKLDRPVEFSNLVRQAWLPHKPLDHDDPAQLVNFDAPDQSSEASSSSGFQVVPVMRTHCDRFSSGKSYMCLRPVQPVNQRSIICKGESGGGVYAQARDGRQIVHGIVSHIRGNYLCGSGSAANDGYYTDVHKLSRWIRLTMLKMSHHHE